MISIKAGASIRGIRSEMLLALQIVEGVYAQHQIPLVITEGTGGTHSEGSLHYVGLALDLRSSNVSDNLKAGIVSELKQLLGAEFDFVVEGDHFHVEFQPKAQVHS